jgi:DNA-binding GntR family transcriptional regulator
LLNDDVKTSLKITKDYYELIFKTAEKHVSWDLVEQLNSRISRLRALTLSSTGQKTSGPKDLFDIIKALEKKDSEQAGEICARHLQEAYEIAMQTDQGIEK